MPEFEFPFIFVLISGNPKSKKILPSEPDGQINDLFAIEFKNFNDLLETIQLISDDFKPDEFYDVSNIQNAIKTLSQGKKYFIISKKNWNKKNFNSILKLYGQEVAQKLLSAAKEVDWPSIECETCLESSSLWHKNVCNNIIWD